MALAQRALGERAVWVPMLGIIGAALFYGDALITPAVSVLSAIEGLTEYNRAFDPYVVPLTAIILIALFSVQARGTASVAAFFGPVMCLWFILIALPGLYYIAANPGILSAFNPFYGVAFLCTHGVVGLATLGAVFLAVTGAEALYADLGHFGKRPIQLAWLGLVLPSLALN
jgi:KUP system potassium uptake protein